MNDREIARELIKVAKSLTMARKAQMHDCYVFNEIDLNDYSSEFIRAVKKLGRKVRAGKKFLYSRKRKLGEMDETFWRRYGNAIDEAINDIWDNSRFDESGEIEKFVKSQGWSYSRYDKGIPTVGDFMC